MPKKVLCNIKIQIVILILLAIIALAGWRVNFFEIDNNGTTLFSSPLANGSKFTTEYIHSVEKTAVVDDYIIADGKIWGWQEIVSSSNAGMPSVLPDYMHFYYENGKLLFRGGRIAPDYINLRVGNETFGKNSATLNTFDTIQLYKTLPGKRLSLSVQKKALLFNRNITEYPFTAWR